MEEPETSYETRISRYEYMKIPAWNTDAFAAGRSGEIKFSTGDLTQPIHLRESLIRIRGKIVRPDNGTAYAQNILSGVRTSVASNGPTHMFERMRLVFGTNLVEDITDPEILASMMTAALKEDDWYKSDGLGTFAQKDTGAINADTDNLCNTARISMISNNAGAVGYFEANIHLNNIFKFADSYDKTITNYIRIIRQILMG